MSRDSIRSALLGSDKTRIIKTLPVNGVDVELRSPPFARRKAVLQRLKLSAADVQNMSLETAFQLKIEGIILCAFAPGDDKPLFGEADRAEIESHSVGGWVDTLGNDVVGIFLNGGVTAEEAKKASEKTASAESSSSSPASSAAQSPSSSDNTVSPT